MPDCRIGLLGGFRVDVDGRPVPPEAWRRRRAAELVKLLGYPKVKNYDGSWTEYGSLVGAPVER